MKKMIFFVGGFAALIAGAAGSTYLFATTPATVPPVQHGSTKVGVVNIGQIFNQYVRAKAFKADLENTLEPHKKKAKHLQEQIKQWQDALNSNNPQMKPQDRDQFMQAIKNNQRELEDMSTNIQKNLGNKQEQNLVTLWKEVNMGITAVAKSQGYHIIMGYGDPMEKEMLDLFPNINRKMQAMDLGSSVPLYMEKSVDISDIVVYNLNKWSENQKPTVQPTGGQK